MQFFTKLCLILTFLFSSLRFGFVPTVVFDAGAPGAPLSSRASGYLYGMAEYDVPDALMVQSLDVSSAAQKAPGGLQHPTGDLGHVSPMLDSADWLVVYLQDAFSTWYYEHEAIDAARATGTWDADAFLEETYFPMIEETLSRLREKDYGGRLVLCPYNECDNGVWFGETETDGERVWGAFTEAGQEAFFSAWAKTYRFLRALAPEMKLGGPGYYEYNADKERAFLTYCAKNGCVPDAMIYHELGERSARTWNEHMEEYRAIEAAFGVGPLPVLVTEYGTMKECGSPAAMLPYIVAIETSGAWGDIAYWRLADNLNDNAADGNMPNACWWLYRWYADLEGSLLPQEKHDLFHADFAKAVREARALKYRTLDTLGCLSDDGKRIDILCGQCGYSAALVLRHLDRTALGKDVRVQIEAVPFLGLTGEVTAPTLLLDENRAVRAGRLRIPLKHMDENAVYHIILTPAGEANRETAALPQRCEAENGTLLGNAYTYRSAYAATGGEEDLVGGMERPGDGVALTVNVKATGDYDLAVIYGKHNDGTGAAGRVAGQALLQVNGEERTLTLQNTIKSEYTACVRETVTLKKGKNTLRFLHQNGTFVLDSVLVSPHGDPAELTLLPEKEASGNGTAAFLAVAPADGCYPLCCSAAGGRIDGAALGAIDGEATVYFRRGLNLLELDGLAGGCRVQNERRAGGTEIPAAAMTLTAPAALRDGTVCGITAAGGAAAFTATVPAAGDYRLTLCYANNQEGGYHAYNVDLIEAYFTLTVNGEAQQVMCRSTYSDERFSTVTRTVRLRAGENAFTLSNDGSIRFADRLPAAPLLRGARLTPAAQ